jgi:hypothetical protein
MRWLAGEEGGEEGITGIGAVVCVDSPDEEVI